MANQGIQAAGGVVLRETPAGREVLVIHRRRYDDWGLPKGKLRPGESAEQAAVREVREETGYDVSLGRRIGEVEYDVKGVPKTVTFWHMRATGIIHPISDPEEVQEALWLHPSDALARLSYPLEKDILTQALAESET